VVRKPFEVKNDLVVLPVNRRIEEMKEEKSGDSQRRNN
jgi:hypothetical protein